MQIVAYLVFGCVLGQINGVPYSCNAAVCKLPTCKCASVDPPVSNPPQFLLITFDDSVQASLLPQAKSLFANRRNPNGCAAKATWFAQSLYSDPYLMGQWYAQGNEIADHSFTHASPFVPTYQELEGMRAFTYNYAGVPRGKIKGFRFPYRNYSVDALELVAKMGFEYDSSMAILDNPIWPYTLDNGVVTECLGANPICGKPINAKGLWEIPLYGSSGNGGFHLMDPYNDFSLTNPIPSQQVTDDLTNAFNAHYAGNRAPFGVYTHPVWLGPAQAGVPDGTQKLAAVNKFLDQAMSRPDVWMVTNYQLLQYMKNPVPASELGKQPYMQCNMNAPTNICNGLGNAGLEDCGFKSANFPQFTTCYGCPSSEPSLANPVPPTASARKKVPDDCDSPYWDPVAGKCLCQDAQCSQWKDTSRPIDLDPASIDKPKTNSQSNGLERGNLPALASILAAFVFFFN